MDDDELNSLEDQVFSTVFDDSASAAAAAAAVETTTSPDLVSNSLEESDKELDISLVLAESEALFNHNIVESTKHNTQQDQSPQGFITLYAAINIVCRDRFAKLWSYFSSQTASFEDHGISQYARRGNSLDEPSPMVYCCKKTRGCLYTTVRKGSLIRHETGCTAGLVAPAVKKTETVATISCHEKNCHQKFRTPDQLNGHHLSVHQFTPTECTQGCNSSRIYRSRKTYQKHVRLHHSSRFPVACRHPGCQKAASVIYQTWEEYSKHLKVTHHLTKERQRERYFPARVPAPGREGKGKGKGKGGVEQGE